jgi:hypothetical protein
MLSKYIPLFFRAAINNKELVGLYYAPDTK